MDRFFGSAILEFSGRNEEVSLCINLSNNILEARFPMDLKNSFKLSFGKSEWMTKGLSLRNIDIKLPNGRLSKGIYDDFFVKEYRPGTCSIYDSTLVSALDLRAGSSGIATMILVPRKCGITFDFKVLSNNEAPYELFYTNNTIRIGPQSRVEIGQLPVIIVGDTKGLTLRSVSSLLNVRDRFRVSWSVLQGAPINLRAILDGDQLTLNLSSDTHTSGLGQLVDSNDEVLSTLRYFDKFFGAMSRDDFSRWETATDFYMDGVATDRLLEFRVISLFNFLEMVDNSKTLNKTSLATLLEITDDTADVLCKVRNALIHEGKTLSDAVCGAVSELKTFKKNNLSFSEFSDACEGDPQKASALFYFHLAACIARFWARSIGYTGDMYQYEDTINDLKSH
jgi:hypothetical protein